MEWDLQQNVQANVLIADKSIYMPVTDLGRTPSLGVDKLEEEEEDRAAFLQITLPKVIPRRNKFFHYLLECRMF